MVQAKHILLVEDDLSSQRLMVGAFKQVNGSSKLHIVDTGMKAVQFLKREGTFSGSPRPHLILLDLNLPEKRGVQVLEELKTNPDLKRIPIIVLTSSRAPADIARCYDLHANCYVVKPADLVALYTLVKLIDQFWIEIVQHSVSLV